LKEIISCLANFISKVFYIINLEKHLQQFFNRHFDLVKQFNSSLISLIEGGGISHPHFYGDFLKKTKKVKYQSNGITLQNAVSSIAQDFLNKRNDKTSLKHQQMSSE